MTARPLLAPFLLFLAGFVVSWIYQTPPSLGDDLNYWGLAFDLHHGVPGAWSVGSFHDLRWPVWGVCWLLQIPFGFSALSYYLEPMIYLGAGAALVYALAREIGATERTAIVAGVLFLFHPQLDTVVDRPMPDLSEGFWVAVAFFAWLKTMRASQSTPKILGTAIVGLALAIGQANRITGVFAIPVLALATIAIYPRQIPWLALSGLFAGVFVGIETVIYHALTGDWLHSLHANLSARGRHGTESIPVWQLPFRFLPALFRGPLDVLFNLFAVLGIGFAWRNFGAPGRALAIYAVGYLLTYSCALQSFSPPRPLVRDGDRFLGSLAFPLAILSAVALTQVLGFLRRSLRVPASPRPRVEFLIALVLLVAGIMLLSTREKRGPNYLHDIAAYLRDTRPGTHVLSHEAMRHVAFMADPVAAARVDWKLQQDLLDPSPTTLYLADHADEIWFNRKWIWTGSRKKSESDELAAIGKIAPYLRPPLAGWSARRAIPKGDVPDFVFLRRSADATPLTEHAPNGHLLRTDLLPDFPVPHTWTFAKPPKDDPVTLPPLPLPPWIANRTLFLSTQASSNTTEPIRIGVIFLRKGAIIQQLAFKAYFFDESSEDFFFVTIPPDADAVQIRLRLSRKTKRITLDSFRLFVDETAPVPAP